MKKSIKIILVAVIVAVVLATCVACSGDRTYQDFTDAEKAMFNGFIGEVIPFLPNDEYYVEADYDAEVMGDYLFYYTFDNTRSEFRSYLKDLEKAGFVAGETEKDMYGDTWYYYSKGDVKLKVSFYRYEGYYTMDVFVYYGVEYDLDGDDGADKPNFNDDEKAMFISVIGEAIPFMSSDNYTLTLCEYDDGSNYISYLIRQSSQEEFYTYIYQLKRAGYKFNYEGGDENNTWYYYVKDEICIDLCIYEGLDGEYIVDIIVHMEGAGADDPIPNDFTADQKQMFIDLIGESIPFLYSDSYTIEGGYALDGTEYVYFGTDKNTQAEFDAYRTAIVNAGYTFEGTEADDNGDTWYYYSKGDIILETRYYEWDTDLFGVDVYVYLYDGGTTDGDTATITFTKSN